MEFRAKAAGSKRFHAAIASILATGLALVPEVRAAEMAGASLQLAITPVPAWVFLRAADDPTDEIWERVPEQAVELTLAPPVHQSAMLLQRGLAAPPPPVPLKVSAISDGTRVYFRLRWDDATRDDQRTIDRFSDAVALQFPLTAANSSPMMGNPGGPVGIWQWKAHTNAARALAAVGPGTLAEARDASLRGKGVYKAEPELQKFEWLVVLSQEVRGNGEHRVNLATRPSIPVAFAVWQGSSEQRDGYKFVSPWLDLRLARGSGK